MYKDICSPPSSDLIDWKLEHSWCPSIWVGTTHPGEKIATYGIENERRSKFDEYLAFSIASYAWLEPVGKTNTIIFVRLNFISNRKHEICHLHACCKPVVGWRMLQP